MAEEKRMASRYANDIEIAHAQRDFQLKKAAYDMEVEAKKAQSNLAADLQVGNITVTCSYLCTLRPVMFFLLRIIFNCPVICGCNIE